MALVKHLEFDTQLFGRKVGMVTCPRDIHLPPANQWHFEEFDLVQAKVLAGNTQLIDQLSDLGFKICEGEIDLVYAIDQGHQSVTSRPGLKARTAGPDDIATVSDLAATAFRGLTRFRQPWFQDAEADLMYSTWMANAVRGAFDDVCLLVENEQGEALGLVTLRAMKDSSDVRIGLLAVRDAARKSGLGGYLIELAKGWAHKQGGTCLKTATQIRNIAAMRLYTKTGAIPVETSYWLYRT